MNDTDEAPDDATLSPRVALLSILGFWLFYFAIVSVRSAVLDMGYRWDMLGRRAIVTVISALATLLLYLILRRIPRRSLGLSVAIAALLSIPTALLYSTVNYLAFRAVSERARAEKMKKTTKVVVIEAPRATRPDGSVPPLPRRQISVHVEDGEGEASEPIVSVEQRGASGQAARETQPSVPSVPPVVPLAPAAPLPPVALDANRRIMVQVGGGSDDDRHELNAVEAIADNAANGYFFIAAWAALYLALCYAAETRVAERRAAGFRAAAQAAEIRALRYQVNPHFLFNTLNSLSSLVLTGKAEAAERMIMNLATFFRTSLTGDPTDDMRLDDEIRLQRLYLDIEAVRFPERLIVVIDIPDELACACVPGLILQPLVENAVKYGVSRARRPVTIRIEARAVEGAMRLSVTDDGDPLPPGDDEAHGTGVGLRNVRERIAARFGDAGACEWGPLPGGGFAVALTLPIVRRDC